MRFGIRKAIIPYNCRPRAHSLQNFFHFRADVGRAFHYVNARRRHRVHLLGGGPFAAGDDRARVAHSTSRRRGLAADEADHGFLDALLDVFGGLFLGRAADLADNYDGVGVGIVIEQFDGVALRRADDRIAADADAGRLADAERGQLPYGFVSQRPAARDHADAAFLVNTRGHDADFAFAGRNDARAVRPDQSHAARPDVVKSLDHVDRRDAFSDADDQRHARVRRLHNRVSRERGRNVNDRSVRFSFAHGVGHGVEHREAFVSRPAFAGRDAADDVRAVIAHLQRVKSPFLAGDALDQQPSAFINQDAQVFSSENPWVRIAWERAVAGGETH